MNVLLIGSGGREHSLAWALVKSPRLNKLYCAPGNGGMAEIATCVEANIDDHGQVIDFCRENNIDFVVIGPEVPLVAGLTDDLAAEGFKVFGPGKEAAQLEGSKAYTKELCTEYEIPTAGYLRCSTAEEAKDYIAQKGVPIVIKADGLAAGKGVIIAESLVEARDAVDTVLGGQFGPAGSQIVIEEFLQGEEASFFALVDGESVKPLITAQDHKRAFDGDKGPNTGGMGAYSPAPVMTEEMCRRTMDEVILPTVRAMKDRGIPYKGVLYAGLMITEEGPKLIEYNVRFGDPECQVLMMRLKSDLLTALLATADGTLQSVDMHWHDDIALTVVMAAKGYPGSYKKGTLIKGLQQAADSPQVEIFHAGTKLCNNELKAVGGRVLNVTAKGKTVEEARTLAYNAIAKIDWPEGFYRSDIAWRAINRKAADV